MHIVQLFRYILCLHLYEILKERAFILIFISTSCSDDDKTMEFKDVGAITGEDLRLCAFCGGWFIDIGTSTYRFYELPKNSNIDLETEEFPILVNLDWVTDENVSGDVIIIERIEKVFLPG